MTGFTITSTSFEFWLIYGLIAVKFFIIGSIWGAMRAASQAQRTISTLLREWRAEELATRSQHGGGGL